MSKLTYPLGALVLAASVLAARAAEKAAADPALLPVTEVILYSSGVGYFDRAGKLMGRQEVDLQFKTDDINDLLKSMVVQDLDGGKITTVTYGSRDPLNRTLKSFAIDLTLNPSLGELLNQIRGERIELSRPNPTVGIIVGVETKERPVADDKVIEVEYINVLTDEGLLSLPLEQVQRIRLLNEDLDLELRQALEVLATEHDTQKRKVRLVFEGDGARRVSVGYIAQTPVWKTSYRLVLGEEKPFLQGWAIVENTTDEDWKNVKLSLVSGRPISFTMDLYQPLYTTRPVVQMELYSSLRPQVYGDAMEAPAAAEVAQADAPLERMGIMSKAAGRPAARERFAMAPAALAAADRRSLQSVREGAPPAAAAQETGELFQYVIRTPVTLARQKSALLPIISQDVAGEKIGIYNESVQAKHPLDGFRLKNTSELHLMQGPVTVFDEGAYAGDAQIEDLAPGQERLISYALDLKTEVEPQVKAQNQELVTAQIRRGTLRVTRRLSQEKLYRVRNRDGQEKNILLEHPVRAGWDLVEPKEPKERTRDVYRFPVSAPPGQTVELTVREEQKQREDVQLSDFDMGAMLIYVRAPQISSKVKQALEQVLRLREKVDATVADRNRREQRVQEISQEQARIRENMTRLNQNSELYNRYVKKLDEQETDIDQLRTQIEELKTQEAQQRQELARYLSNLELD